LSTSATMLWSVTQFVPVLGSVHWFVGYAAVSMKTPASVESFLMNFLMPRTIW